MSARIYVCMYACIRMYACMSVRLAADQQVHAYELRLIGRIGVAYVLTCRVAHIA
jgi:hypothetical protein